MTSKIEHFNCIRCGMARLCSRKSSVLCKDCRYVLSENERKLWIKEQKVAA